MTKPPYNKVFLTLIKEVKDFLPEIEKLISLLKTEDSDKNQITTELNNIISTIMGVSSMMNLDTLTNTSALLNRVLDNIIKDKLIWNQQLINAVTETIQQIDTYCSAYEAKEDLDDSLFQNALSALGEFEKISVDDSNETDNQEEEFELDFFEDMEIDGDSDEFFEGIEIDEDSDESSEDIEIDEDSEEFFEDLDMDIIEEEDIPSDISSEILDPVVEDSEIADSGMADIDPEFIESFNEESKDHLNNINQELNLLAPSINNKTNISDQYRETLHSIRRSVHTLKGAAAVIGIKSVASFGNEFEDFLDWLHDESDSLSPEIITAMFDGTDIIGELSVNPAIKIDEKIDEIKIRFKNIIADSSEDIVEKEQNIDSEIIDEQIVQPEDIEQPEEIEQIKTSKTILLDDEDPSNLEKTDIDPEFLESFNEESKDHLNNISQKLNLLSPFIKEKTDIFDGYREILHSIRRSVHTLKGAAAVIGIKSVASFGNEFEDFLDWLHDEAESLSPDIITVMLDGTDILEKLSVNPIIKIDKEIDEIKNRFKNIIADASEDIVEAEQIHAIDADKEQNIELKIIDEPIVKEEEIEQIKTSATLYESDDNAESLDDFLEDLDLDIFDGGDTSPDMSPKIDRSEMTDSGMADIDPEFLESFNEESRDHLNSIGQMLNLLSPSINEKTDINDEFREMLHSIRRSVHTLKGAAAVIGIKSVASFGNEFEDFLDWLHDESDSLYPIIITVMLDGTDILEKLSVSPTIKIDEEIDEIIIRFKAIMADSSEDILEKEQKAKSEIIDEQIDELLVQPRDKSIKQPLDKPEIKQVKAPKTIRVDMGKVDQMIGLIGDMTINLSSHEDSSQFFQTTLNEFDNTMKRLKDITLNLETGFKLAEIPHFSPVTGSAQKEDHILDEFDPLEMDRYSDLHIMIRSLNEAVADLNSIMDQTIKVQNLWQSTMGRQRNVINEIQNSMQLIKMTPFSTLSNRLHKTVRESARVTEKFVQLIIEGDYMEMDTHVWDVLADPLMHLLRNSVDHGIESPDERKKLKKPKQATIRIKCVRRGSWLNMHFSDDGKGLDYDAIRNKASKLYPQKDVSTMDNDELTAMIFEHGFTIKTVATTISGRGVGMDVVNHAVKQLNGNIKVISIPGKGVEFILRLPIEVAQLPALLVKFGQQEFAVPLRDITRVFKINRKQSTENNFKLDNTTLPLLRPTEIMGLEPMSQPVNEDPFALSVDVGGENGVLVTDAILGKKDIVFKNLGSHLHNQVPCIAGATIMGNGSLIPILNTEELFFRQISSVKLGKKPGLETDSADKMLNVLIVDDSISIRKVLSNFITNNGWHPSVAKDGVDAMEMIRQHSFDLILLDIEMPRMNGFDVLQSLQLHLDYSDIPVLMLTSRSAKKYRNKATDLGAKGFVTKPFKDDELLSLINSHIGPAIPTKKIKTGN